MFSLVIFLYFVVNPGFGLLSDVVDGEPKRLGKNLVVLRKDFNKIVENVEDLAADFFKQIGDASKVMENAYNTDYNWEDENSNYINKEHDSKESTNTPTTIPEETISPPKTPIHLFQKIFHEKIPQDTGLRRTRRATINEFPNNGKPMDEVVRAPNEKLFVPTNENNRENVLNKPRLQMENVKPSERKGDQDSMICTAKTQKEVELEKRKLDELKYEVQKLNELVFLLKDQQKFIKMFDPDTNEIDTGNADQSSKTDSGNTKNTFLHKVIQQLKNDPSGSLNNKKDIRGLPETKSEINYYNNEFPNPAFEELEKIKYDLKRTGESLNKTKEFLVKEKLKEDVIEEELKRQKSELKFLKVMVESLYDQKKNESGGVDRHGSTRSNFDDVDIDSMLGSMHTPKPLPAAAFRHDPTSNNKRQQETTRFFETANPHTRESNPTNNDDSNMKKILTILGHQGENNTNGKKVAGKQKMHVDSQNRDGESAQDDTKNQGNSFENSKERASSNVKSDDLKLKILSMLEDGEGREITEKPKTEEDKVAEEIRKFIKEEKQREQSKQTLNALMKQFAKRDETSASKSIPQDDIIKLLANVNRKPQSKSDDIELDNELKQLQQAISSLRPKEDNILDNFNIPSNVNNKGKNDGDDFQSMLSQIISQNGGGQSQNSVNIGGGLSNIEFPAIAGNRPNKLTAQQMFQLSQLMGKNNGGSGSYGYNSHSSAAGPLHFSSLKYGPDKPSNIAQQYSSPYSNNYEQNNYVPNQYDSLKNLLNNYGSSNGYGGYNLNSNSYEPNLNSYSPHSNLYSASSNSYGYNSNSYGPSSSVYSHTSNSYSPSSNSLDSLDTYDYPYNSYSSSYGSTPSNLYSHNLNSYSPNSNGYTPGNNYGGNEPSYGGSYPQNSNNYGPKLLAPYSNSKYPSVTSNSYSGPPQAQNYGSYSSNTPSYGYSGSGLNPNGYQNSGSNYNNKYPYPSGSKPALPQNYLSKNPVAPYQPGYPAQNPYSIPSSLSYPPSTYNQQFFPQGQPGGYPGAPQIGNYGPKGPSGSGLDQSQYNPQSGDQYKYVMVSDLKKQVESLESVINGLNRADYTQTAEDKATIASLEQRIYDLKGVISNLNKPSYGSGYGGTSYGAGQETYKAGQPQNTPYQAPHKASQGAYGSTKGPIPASYGATQLNTPNQSQSYSSNQPSNVAGQTAYGASQPGQLSYPSNPPNPSGQAPYEPSPQSQYEAGPPPYGAKLASYEGTSSQKTGYDHKGVESEVQSGKPYENERKSRRKRQVEDGEMNRQAEGGVMKPISVNVRQDLGGENREARLELGDDALTQVANIFKKYFDDNVAEDEQRSSNLDGLKDKLDLLKKQLEYPGQFRSFSVPPVPYPNNMYQPNTYNNHYQSNYQNDYHYPTTSVAKVKDKHQDIFTKIVLKILDKLLGTLPDVLGRLFGNAVSEIGDSYGDSYSPLQAVFKNLGAFGHIPLIMVKILESVSAVFKILRKNQFFKQFLLPGITLALAGGSILFLIYFFQQDDGAYGYTDSYHDNKYQNAGYGYKSNYGNYGKQDSSYYRSNMEPVNFENRVNRYSNDGNRGYGSNVRGDFGNNIVDLGNGHQGGAPLQYSRGYFDYGDFRQTDNTVR